MAITAMVHSLASRMQHWCRKLVDNPALGHKVSSGLFSLLTLVIGLVIGVLVLNPLWGTLAQPNLFPAAILPPITGPIDGLFYIRNAELGYAWSTRDPLSLWFHPLLSSFLQVLPGWLPKNSWFWLISLVFAAACLPLIFRLTVILTGNSSVQPKMIPLCLVAPGGLSLATGNAEIPTLFFSTLLLLSVLAWEKWWLTVVSAAAAILTKPNALYMVAVLFIYFLFAVATRNLKLWKHSLLGMAALLGGWLIWIWIVDWQTGHPGAYWEARLAFSPYSGPVDLRGFFEQWLNAFLVDDLRNQIRFSTAILIPMVSLIVIGLVPFASEPHRYAFAAGNLAMLIISLALGNPNKILLYATTLPGYFVTHLVLLAWLISQRRQQNMGARWLVGACYLAYCVGMQVVYVIGTPLGWYF